MSNTESVENRHIALIIIEPIQSPTQLESLLSQLTKTAKNRLNIVIIQVSKNKLNEQFKAELKVVSQTYRCDMDIIEVSEYRYGKFQKLAFGIALNKNADYVVLLDANGVFDPAVMDDMLATIANTSYSLVLASRFNRMSSLRSLISNFNYKYFANIILAFFANFMIDQTLTDWHSAYRIYSKSLLSSIPYQYNSDDFLFDFEVLLQAKELSANIFQVFVLPFSGTNMNFSEGISFFLKAAWATLRYRAHKIGFGTGTAAFNSTNYDLKDDFNSSHNIILKILSTKEPLKILDLGCSDGEFSKEMRELGHHVTGVDIIKLGHIEENVDEFIQADIDQTLNANFETKFDVIVAADVLEHLKNTRNILGSIYTLLKSEGILVISVPNFSHWYARLKVGLGLFDYDRRGIFDYGHLRFFTMISLSRMLDSTGFEIVQLKRTTIPTSVFKRGKQYNGNPSISDTLLDGLDTIQNLAVKAYPNLFAYQLILVAKKRQIDNDLSTVYSL